MVSNHPLKAYRDQIGITQDALAKELGVSSITVSRWETGARKIEATKYLDRVSERTGIPKRELRPDLAEVMREAAE